jgi:Tol biopolymer transport system component
MAHPDGSALRRISAPTEIAGTPHWSPDGTHVAYWAGDPEQVCRGGLIFGTGTTQIVSVNLDSGARDTVTSGAGVKVFPRWVGAGRIVYQTREGRRFVGDDSLLPGEFQAADWSPDHRAMVFHREIDTRGDRDRPFQSRASLDRRFALLRVPDASSFAPAGDRMVYMLTNFNGPLRSGTLMVANADGSDRHAIYAGPLTEDMTGPAWSPRGDWIAFTSKRDGDYEIYRIRPDGSGLQRLTRSPGNDAHQVFSPDGEWIAFATARQGFKDEAVGLLLAGTFQPYGEIAVMRADGSDVRLLTDNSTEEGAPSWIPRQHR